LRRIVVVATALAVLVTAVSAYAATGGFNTYTATVKVSPNKAGSAGAPAAVAFTEKYVASGTNGNRTAPLTEIKTKAYGIVTNGKSFPTCSLAKIQAAKSDTVCPKGALVAKGAITAILGPTNDPSASAPGRLPCNPLLHGWNGGQGKVVFFFVDQAPDHTCAGGAIQTGTVGPFPATIKTVGKTLVLDTPIPSYVSFPITGIEGSLTSETLNWLKVTTKVGGKTVAYASSVACNKGKRPYSHAFTAEQNGQSQSATVSGTQKCS
jgi:hypothetical protein